MRIVRLALLAALVTSFVSPALAADKIFEGTVVCAKCYLKEPDARECQDVLLVPQADGAKREYYITKNEVAKQSGEACTAEVKARVTGTVSQKDGTTWLTPSKIERQ